MAKSHSEDRRYLCRFHPCNEISMRLYEIFETGKKQDLALFMYALMPLMLQTEARIQKRRVIYVSLGVDIF